VNGVSFSLKRGEVLGLVGESGSGKSVTGLSILRLVPDPPGKIVGGRIFFNGADLTQLSADKMHEIRGKRISMIFQEPMTSLNPVHKIGKQLGEVFRLHFSDLSGDEIRQQSLELLQKVGIPEPEQRMEEYPHQNSGGMRQRVMIALALACKPDILIADEPTTALDVTIQAQILDLIQKLQSETGMAVLVITHDLGVIAETCEDVVVMYAGKVAETAAAIELFKNPKHPYTQGLLDSIPRLETPRKTKLNIIKGMVPSLYELPSGCRFRNRCLYAMDICAGDPPPMFTVGTDHFAACYLY
jgi:oligopeptide/dipeptide ABC transporter ATP-binding protein